MFTMMENRKRPRFEMINVNNNNCNEIMQGVASTSAHLGTATLAAIGGQSFILSNSSNTPIPANVLLSICDEISDDAEEYILDHSLVTPSKRERTVPIHSTNNKSQLQQTNLITTDPQYRIINQAGKSLNSASVNAAIINNTAVNANNNLVGNNLNFPPGCEIYVVKEFFDTHEQVIAESNTSPKTPSGNGTTIKLGNISSLPLQRHSILNPSKGQTLISNSAITINSTPPVTCATNSPSITVDETPERSMILEAYKKRDDQRRAIHNEVERRRRDKINSWIFRLKELLPSEVTTNNINNSSSAASNNQNNFTNMLFAQQQGTANTTRSASNGSKSNVLIKACEYIKSMQEEINSLRECLKENENLRLKNRCLQDEIDSLRAKQQKSHDKSNILLTTNNSSPVNNDSNNNSDNSECEITLNSLNTTYADVQLFSPSTNEHNNTQLTDLVGLTTNSHATTLTPSSVNVTYAKRKLIITDYVD